MRATPRIPSLDGLRALSIIAVLLGHMAGTRGFPSIATHVIRNGSIDMAELGVRVFFVISGFLITDLLMREQERTGEISLASFYWRRTRRIMPAYLSYVAIIALVGAAVTGRDIVHALTYSTNYSAGRSWVVGHLWSLSVEEQFYLLWPAVVAFASRRTAMRVAVATICVVPLIRVAESTLFPGMRPLIGTSFETAADALAMGCALALLRDTLFAQRWYRGIIESPWPIVVFAVVGIATSLRYRPGLLIGIPLTNIAITLLIDRVVRQPSGWLGRLLNTRSMVYVGMLSYSLYLWQQPFLNRAGTHILNTFPLNIACAVSAAIASYYLIENRFRRVGRQHAPSGLPGMPRNDTNAAA